MPEDGSPNMSIVPPPGLYYPLADFPDQRWLKVALLNWDQIQRIRPSGYREVDRDLTRRIRDLDADALIDLHPDDEELWEVGERFEELLHHAAPRLMERYSVDRIESWPVTNFDSRPEGGDPRLAFVYAATTDGGAAKILYMVSEELRRLGLGVVVEDPSGSWLGVHPRLASVYMCALTEAMADRRVLRPLTHDRRAHQASGRSTLDRLEQVLTGSYETAPPSRTSDEVEAQYIEVTLAASLQPIDIDDVSISQIIEFRHEHKLALRAFHNYLNTLETDFTEIGTIANAAEVERRLLRLYRDETEPRLRELHARLRRFGIMSALSALTLRIDGSVAANTLLGAGTIAAGAAIGLPVLGAIPAGVALAAVPFIAGRREEHRRLKRESAVSYLLALQHGLSR